MIINNDEKLVPLISVMADECEPSIVDKDRCDMGLAFAKCMNDEITKKKIKVDLF